MGMKVHNNSFSRSSYGLELIFNSMETNISIADGLNTHQLISNFMETKRMFALVIGVIMAILSPLIVAGNALIILVVWKDPLRNLRSFTSTYILLSMAVADFLVGAILCPLNSDWSLLIRAGDKPSFSIRVPLTINAVLTSVSIGHVLLLTIDRLFALLTPLQYRVRVTNRLVSITAHNLGLRAGFGSFTRNTYRTLHHILHNLHSRGSCISHCYHLYKCCNYASLSKSFHQRRCCERFPFDPSSLTPGQEAL